MAESDATEILQRLFRTPPREFVAERNRIAKALKSEGEKELAAAVSAVRRPGVGDWALDVAAAEHPDDIAELVEAANEVIDAQEAAMEGRDSGDLRIRLKLLRVCTATVASLAGAIAERAGQTGAGSSVTDITTRLSEIAANRNALDLLQRGLLGAEDPGVADPFGIAATTVAERPAAKATKPAKQAKAEPKPAPKAPTGPSVAERKRLRDALTQAKKALTAAESQAEAAERAVAKQETAVAKAEARVAEAEARLEALRADVVTATEELQAARGDSGSSSQSLDSAREALDAAEQALAG